MKTKIIPLVLFFFISSAISITSTTKAQEKADSAHKQIKEAQANRKILISELNNLAALAQQYYRKPTGLGGGGNSFSYWFIPQTIETTKSGVFYALVAKDSVVLTGIGHAIGNDGKKKVRIIMGILPNKIKSVKMYN